MTDECKYGGVSARVLTVSFVDAVHIHVHAVELFYYVYMYSVLLCTLYCVHCVIVYYVLSTICNVSVRRT